MLDSPFRPADPTSTEGIPAQDIAHVLWYFGDQGLGREPGDFTKRLLRTFSAADMRNFSKLAVVFPDLAKAFHIVSRVDGGLEALRTAAKAATK